MNQGKLLCFADDCLLICENKQEASDLIEQMNSLQDSGLHLNKAKTQIIGDHDDLKNCKEILGVEVKT